MSHKIGIYAIVDTLTKSVIQSVLPTYRHEAAAIRDFGEIMQNRGPVSAHPTDHQLVRLGWLHEATHEIEGEFAVVITGEQWLAAQQKANPTSTQH